MSGAPAYRQKIDRRMAPLSTKLESGQTIEVVTSSLARPNPAWLNFVVTAKARTAIRHYLKNLTSEDSIRLGHRLLDQALAEYALSLSDVPNRTFKMVLEEYSYESLNELLSDIGLGNRLPKLVARRIAPGELETNDERPQNIEPKPLSIKGTEGLTVSFGRCCHPIPGDNIVGFMSAGRGVVIHRKSCKNFAGYRGSTEKWLYVEWAEETDNVFSVIVRVDVTNSRGILAQVATVISESGSNIESVKYDDKEAGTASLFFEITVFDRKMLARVMRKIRSLKSVLKVSRTRG